MITSRGHVHLDVRKGSHCEVGGWLGGVRLAPELGHFPRVRPSLTSVKHRWPPTPTPWLKA